MFNVSGLIVSFQSIEQLFYSWPLVEGSLMIRIHQKAVLCDYKISTHDPKVIIWILYGARR